MSSPLEKIIELIKKTGDNCIVLDAGGEPAYAIMTFDDYQKLILGKSEVAGLTEDQLLEKINRDISIWRAGQQEHNLENWSAIPLTEKAAEPAVKNDKKSLNGADFNSNGSEADQTYFFEPID